MTPQRPISHQPLPEHAQKVFDGVLFNVYHWEQEMFDGTKKTFEKLRRADSSIVVPVLPDGKILLTKQQQPGTAEYVSMPSGGIEPGENSVEAAHRELLEETGYEAESMTLWHAEHPSTKIDWVIYTFIAKGLKKVADIQPDGGEKIELFPVTVEEFIDYASKQNLLTQRHTVELVEAKHVPELKQKLKELLDPNTK